MSEKKVFKIVNGMMPIYNAPNGSVVGNVPQGISFEADATSRTEQNGFVWWKHSAGWSRERTLDGSQIFLQEVVRQVAPAPSPAVSKVTAAQASAPAPTTPPVQTPPAAEPPAPAAPVNTATTTPATPPTTPATTAAAETLTAAASSAQENGVALIAKLAGGLAAVAEKANLRTKTTVRVRDAAGGKRVLQTLPVGEVVQADMQTLLESGGYFWVEHTHGWSAVQDVAGLEIFFEDAGNVYVPGPDGPVLSEMPGYQSLITQLPVALEETEWFQYFGNTSFAYVYGQQFNYHGFAQGYHSGLDFGNNTNPTTATIVAGLEGVYVKTEVQSGKPWNTKLYVKSGDFLVIYQHILKPNTFEKGQPIYPFTEIANMHPDFPGGPHLHWEIRFWSEKYIVNPLALMKPELVERITRKFDPARAGSGTSGSRYYYFYQKGSWSQYTSPLDQPVIVRGATPTAPKYVGA